MVDEYHLVAFLALQNERAQLRLEIALLAVDEGKSDLLLDVFKNRNDLLHDECNALLNSRFMQRTNLFILVPSTHEL